MENEKKNREETRCIYIKGQPIEDLVRGCNYKVLLGTTQEIVFNFHTDLFTDLTVEIEPSLKDNKDILLNGVYDVLRGKLISGSFNISNQGIPYHIEVSRFFDGTFIIKGNADGKRTIMGRYKTQELNPLPPDGYNPELWIEPIYIGYSSLADLKLLHSAYIHHKQKSYEWIKTLDQFNHEEVFRPEYRPEDIQHLFDDWWHSDGYACVRNEPEEVGVAIFFEPKPEIKKKAGVPLWVDPWGSDIDQFKTAKSVPVKELESLLSSEDYEELRRIVEIYLFSEEYESKKATILEGLQYGSENKHLLAILNKNVEVKWVAGGYLAIVFKGYNPPFFRYASLKHAKLSGITGGIHITKDITRTWSSIKETLNPKKVIKNTTSGSLAKIGLAIDLIGDYKTVCLDSTGSRDIIELFGRAGISLTGAFITTIASTTVLSLMMRLIGFTSVTIPVWVVVVIGGAVVIVTTVVISGGMNKIKNKIWGENDNEK